MEPKMIVIDDNIRSGLIRDDNIRLGSIREDNVSPGSFREDNVSSGSIRTFYSQSTSAGPIHRFRSQLPAITPPNPRDSPLGHCRRRLRAPRKPQAELKISTA